MASIAFEEYKNKLNNLRPALDDLGGALHLDEARNEVEKLEEESAQDGFWNDTENSQRVQKRIKTLQLVEHALRQEGRLQLDQLGLQLVQFRFIFFKFDHSRFSITDFSCISITENRQ